MGDEDSSGRDGWFAYEPIGAEDHYAEPPVLDVYLSEDEYSGPFRYSEGSLGDDFDELETALGISRALYDDVMAWHAAAQAPGASPDDVFHTQQDLLCRLAAEVGPTIKVPNARDTPPLSLSLLEDDLDALPIPAALREEVLRWRAAAAAHSHATGDKDEKIHAWQDAGPPLAREVAAALGDDYQVKAF